VTTPRLAVSMDSKTRKRCTLTSSSSSSSTCQIRKVWGGGECGEVRCGGVVRGEELCGGVVGCGAGEGEATHGFEEHGEGDDTGSGEGSLLKATQ
jgi:hypothetical protein